MNEKIKELYEIAWQYTHDIATNVTGDPIDFQSVVKQAFAELIVKECAYLVNDYQRKTGYTDHAKMLCNEFNIEYKDEDYYARKD